MSPKFVQETLFMKIIAHIHTDFPTKFGIPRQSGLVKELQGFIVFEPKYRNFAAFRGLEGFSHIWLLWQFSQCEKRRWSATVKPPRLEGKRMGVFATRSPFRPNNIGLSCVKLEGMDKDESLGPVLRVSGADLMDKTPIYDIKPYVPFADCHPEALEGYTGQTKVHKLQVEFPPHLLERFSGKKKDAIIGVLAQDPRPAYIRDSERIYGVAFGGLDVKFTVEEDILRVCDVVPIKN